MKLYKALLTLTMVAVAGLFTACDDEGYWDKYNFTDTTYSFEQGTHSYSLKATDPLAEVQVTVVRGTTEGNVDVPTILTANSDIITVADTVAHFVDGSSTAVITISIDEANIEMGKNYVANLALDVPEEQLSISGTTVYNLTFVKDYNWVPAGTGKYAANLFGELLDCTFEMAEGYKGGYYCRITPFAAGYSIPFYLDEAGNAAGIPDGEYNMGIQVNGSSFSFYYYPESGYGSYCKPLENDGNIFNLYGVWCSAGTPSWIAKDAFQWVEGWPGEAGE